MVTFQSARVLVTEGTLFFDPPLRWGEQIIGTSKYGVGMTLAYLAYLIPLRLMRPELFTQVFDATLAYDQQLLSNDLYLYSSTLNALVVAALAVITYLTAREVGLSRRWSTAGALAATLASPLAVYARMDFSQPMTSLCLMAALWLWLRAAKSRTWLLGALAGMCMAFGVLVRLDFVLVMAPSLVVLAAWGVRRAAGEDRRQRLAGLWLAAGAVGLAVGIVLTLNAVKFGSPLSTGYPNAWNTSLWPMVQGLVGQLISPGAGLLWHFPLSGLLAFGSVFLVRQRHPVGLMVVGLLLSHLALYSLWRNWPGGYAWGPRFLVPLVPLMTLAVMIWCAAQPRWRGWVVGAIAVSWIVSLNGILFSFLDVFSSCDCLALGPVGIERFMWAGSPLLAGWAWPANWHALGLVEAFNLLWLKALIGSPSAVVAVVGLAGVILAAMAWLTWHLRRAALESGVWRRVDVNR